MEGGPSIQERDSDLLTRSLDGDSVENERRGFYGFCCHPSGNGHRYIALIFMCFLGFGSYFCYDNPAALQNYIEKDLNLTVSEYTMLYSLYSWPNVILCFIGGVLIDKVFGIRLGANIYMGLTLLGQLGFATGVILHQYWLMLVGRFIFGIGGESLAVAQNNYAVLWFKGKELNMVFGLQLSFSRVGSTVNFVVMEPLYSWVSTWNNDGVKVLGIVLFIAAGTCIFSMLCSLILGILDKRAEKMLRRNYIVGSESLRGGINFKDFNCSFWLITVICVCYYVTIFPFMALAKDFFTDKFHISNDEANNACSIIYIISGVMSPILGFLIDRCGKNITWILTAILVTVLSHSLLAFTMITPFVAMAILGVAYSALASSLWPLVSLIIPEQQLGTAYGICQAIQNLGLAVVAIIVGIIAQDYGFIALEGFFLGSLFLATLATIGLWAYDKKRRGILNMTPRQRERHQIATQVMERESLLSASADEILDSDPPINAVEGVNGNA